MQCDTLPVKLGHHKLNSNNNLWFQRNVVVNFLKSQKFTDASVWWNEMVIKIRGKQGEEVDVKVRS